MGKIQIIRSVILLFLIASFVSCAGIQARQAQSEFDDGLSLFNRGHYDDAIPHFEKATEIDPDFAKAYLYLGRSYLNIGKWKEAVPPLRTAYRLSPGETKKEVADIILDIILRKGSLMDKGAQSEILDLLRQ
ncbi:MAG: tetratricopeptide repeat protein [Thermodesulfovibrionales bacterium]|nr:tetratricopeptide repeat protein [Thermodesulfovibrionales bacterium]